MKLAPQKLAPPFPLGTYWVPFWVLPHTTRVTRASPTSRSQRLDHIFEQASLHVCLYHWFFPESHWSGENDFTIYSKEHWKRCSSLPSCFQVHSYPYCHQVHSKRKKQIRERNLHFFFHRKQKIEFEKSFRICLMWKVRGKRYRCRGQKKTVLLYNVLLRTHFKNMEYWASRVWGKM